MIASALCIIFFALNVALRLSLTRMQYPFVAGGEMTAVARAHPVFLSRNRALLCAQARRFAVGQLAGPMTSVNQALLVQLAQIDCGIGWANCANGNADGGEREDESLHGVHSLFKYLWDVPT
jgi:hypothetical protein